MKIENGEEMQITCGVILLAITDQKQLEGSKQKKPAHLPK